MTAEKFAVIAYGIVAYIAALVLSVMVGSKIAGALVFVAAGLTYVFQVAQLTLQADDLFEPDGHKSGTGVLDVLMAAAIFAAIASVAVSLVFGG